VRTAGHFVNSASFDRATTSASSTRHPAGRWCRSSWTPPSTRRKPSSRCCLTSTATSRSSNRSSSPATAPGTRCGRTACASSSTTGSRPCFATRSGPSRTRPTPRPRA
jgi:hypothetical protein